MVPIQIMEMATEATSADLKLGTIWTNLQRSQQIFITYVEGGRFW